jgi:hypothetical protein
MTQIGELLGLVSVRGQYIMENLMKIKLMEKV